MAYKDLMVKILFRLIYLCNNLLTQWKETIFKILISINQIYGAEEYGQKRVCYVCHISNSANSPIENLDRVKLIQHFLTTTLFQEFNLIIKKMFCWLYSHTHVCVQFNYVYVHFLRLMYAYTYVTYIPIHSIEGVIIIST